MEKRTGAVFYISSGYKSRPPLDPPLDPQKVYGKDWAPEGMGANFLVDLSWDSSEEAEYNWKELLRSWDHKFFNDTTHFLEGPITLELLCLKLYEDLQKQTGLQSLSLTLRQGDFQYAKTSYRQTPNVSWAKSIKFNSLHRHHNENLTKEENEVLFRKCSQVHGHEYLFTIEAQGELDKNTGVVVWHEKLENILAENVIEPLHGALINDIIGNTSGETLLAHLQTKLSPLLAKNLNWKYFLRETRRNSFSVNS